VALVAQVLGPRFWVRSGLKFQCLLWIHLCGPAFVPPFSADFGLGNTPGRRLLRFEKNEMQGLDRRGVM